MTFRRTLAVLAVPALLALGACSDDGAAADDGGPEPTEITFGYTPDFAGASLLAVAEEQGLWEEHGITAEAVSFTNGPLQIQALGSGDLDFGYVGNGALWLPATGEADVLAINALGVADRVIAQPGSGIESIADLAGRTVGVPEGTSGENLLNLALEAEGLTQEDVEVVAMDASTAVTAFASGQIDAAALWYPLIDTVKGQVPDLVELASNADFLDTVSFPSAFVTSPTRADEDAELVSAVQAVLREANDYRAENLDASVEITAEFLDLEAEAVAVDAGNVQLFTSAELAEMSEDGTIDTWLTAMNEIYVEQGTIEGEPLAPAEYYLGESYVSAG